ncbi:MAG TPA: hypothetical protein VE621_21145 [Bryobacteraceae bacterium]|nr:hypothetical protein [Bryobacteraceae bacterium]
MRRLLLLNLFLLALVVVAGIELRNRLEAAKRREEKLLRERVTAPPAPQLAAIPPVAPVTASSYVEVADKVLFVPDRNPTVVKVEKAPAPPPPMPPLPFQYGVMDFGQGPTVMLAEKSGSKQKGYRPGDKIGDFKLLAVNNTHILLEWQDKRVLKRLDELIDRSAAAAAAAAPEPTKAAAAAPPPPAQVTPVGPTPGASMGNDFKACVAGDNSPSGTVVNGMRKMLMATPFGQQCRWEPVK